MDYHQNARLTIHSREQLARRVVMEGCTLKQAAACFGVSAKTAAKWVRRFREQGSAGLRDRRSRPHRLHRPTSAELVERVEQLRRQRWTGLRISQQTGLSRATVSRILRRLRLSRMRDLEPKPVVRRYEHAEAGDAQNRLSVAMRNVRVKIGLGVRDERAEGFQILAEGAHALVPGFFIGRRGRRRPVAAGPVERLVVGITRKVQ